MSTLIPNTYRLLENIDGNGLILPIQLLMVLLAPFAPHLVEELWLRLGHCASIFLENWPEYDKKLAQADEIELVIQINGKVRDKIKTPADISEHKAKKLALASDKIQKHLANKKPKQVIFVKGRLVNIVI